jgi:nucleosome assembly protein 1-like 1
VSLKANKPNIDNRIYAKLCTDTKQTRVVKKTVPTESFFRFFSPPKPPADDEDDAASDIEDRLELDYQLGEDIKEKLIPHAIDWFTGEALAFEELDEDDLEEGDFEDDDDEEDDDLSEDRDDEEESDDDVNYPYTYLQASIY